MFREMGRNKKQILSEERCSEVLNNCTSGVLNLIGDNGYPYGVPLSYSYTNGKIYFHCAKKGHKIDAIKKNDKASFTVIETDQIVPEEFTSYFRSVIVFGKVKLINDDDEMRTVLNMLVSKYSPKHIEAGKEEIEKQLRGVQIIEFDIEHISGKEAIEFTR